jgi:DNA invertase Pin-like site-specific DNA recombinase
MTIAVAEQDTSETETAERVVPVVAYYRMSTAKQDTSVDQQRREVERYANERGFDIIREYIDSGVSGDKTDKRIQFQKMLKDADYGEFEKVVCWDQDRFGRFDSLEAGKWLTPMRDAGIGLTTVGQGDFDLDTFAGRIVYQVNQEGKHTFLKDLSNNICRKFQQMASDGFVPSGVAAYGYDRAYIDAAGNEVMRVGRTEESPVKSRKLTVRLVPGDPDEMRWIKWMFHTYANEDVGMTYLRDHLNKNKVPTSRRGKHWTIPSIHKMLTNERYCGDLIFGRVRSGSHHYITKSKVVKVVGKKQKGKHRMNATDDRIVVRDTHEPLIDRATFAKVQRKRATNKIRTTPNAKTRADYLLSGLLICKKCGCRMTGRRHKERITYQCDNYVRYGTVGGCRLWSVNQDVFVEFIMNIVKGIVGDAQHLAALREAVERKLIESAERGPNELGRMKTKLRTLQEEYDDARANVLAAPTSIRNDLFDVLEQLKERKDKLKQEIDDHENVDSSSSIAARVEETLALLEELVRDHRKAKSTRLSMLIRRIVRRVELSFRVRPGTEKLKRQTFEVSQGILTLECALPVSVVNGSSEAFTGFS